MEPSRGEQGTAPLVTGPAEEPLRPCGQIRSDYDALALAGLALAKAAAIASRSGFAMKFVS